MGGIKFGDELTEMVAVGAVTPTSVRFWMRSARAGVHYVVIEPKGSDAVRGDGIVIEAASDFTGACTYPDDFPDAAPLAPATEYELAVFHSDDTLLGRGRFTTAPDPASRTTRFTFAALSCHQPFEDDGTVAGNARRMLLAAHQAMAARNISFFLAMGDQIYADAPKKTSLFEPDYFVRVGPPGREAIDECSREEVRGLYQQRHRQFWALPELQRIYADFPSWPMLDDHEIVDNFGSTEQHASAECESLRQGALDAFYDYQAARALPAGAAGRPRTFDNGFRWGGAAIYQLDIRSERRVHADGSRMLAASQVVALAEFLEKQRDARLCVVMIPVPMVFVPSWLANAAAIVTGDHEGPDRWSHESSLTDRDRIFRVLVDHARRHDAQKILLLSGDIHSGTAFEIRWNEGPVFHQLTASAVTNKESRVMELLFELAPRAETEVLCGDSLRGDVSLIPAADGAPSRNPFGRLNIGFVHVDDDGVRARVQLELVSAAEDDSGTPETVYLSPWLS